MSRSVSRPAPARVAVSIHVPASRSSSFENVAIAAKGFRPFFLLAATFAVLVLPRWLFVLFGANATGGYFDPIAWHAHEMVFGFAVAVIAGFLLTAVSNWTGRDTATGGLLLALAGLWVCGRLAVSFASLFPRWVPAILDIAFLPSLIFVLARPLIAAKNSRNFVMLGILAILSVLNMSTHLAVLRILDPAWEHHGSVLAVDIVVFIILVIAGRVFPMFTRNATGVELIRSSPLFDALALLAMATVVALDAVVPEKRYTATASALAGILIALRSIRWGARHSLKDPMLWILHLGYLWIPIGLLLRGVDSVPAPLARHALTLGAIGTLTLGMMTRVSLGHTGRSMKASRAMTCAFILISLAAFIRVGLPVLQPSGYRASILVAGILWTFAFAIYVAQFARPLLTSRVDGKPG